VAPDAEHRAVAANHQSQIALPADLLDRESGVATKTSQPWDSRKAPMPSMISSSAPAGARAPEAWYLPINATRRKLDVIGKLQH
jgi:hypothetical protein